MSNAIRMGVVGLSSDHVWSMAGTFQGLANVELVALADTDQELLDKGAKVFGVDTVYHDYVEMLAQVKPREAPMPDPPNLQTAPPVAKGAD